MITGKLEGEIRAVTRLQITPNVFKSFSSLEVLRDGFEMDKRPLMSQFANFVSKLFLEVLTGTPILSC